MILKWKTILTNWINCYTSETEKREQNITPENLLNIFTHIHESFRLDDSKSSKFEASTIQDFIVEKYPGFKFENGTLEVTCEEEVYIVASLLLFYICVNSKNAEMKRAMCSKLSAGDQETIMKFSKCLMDCSPILYADVEAAITEACGPDATAQVAETPPALRSLHGEVRRLQAALDAERFDKNYLQDELARTNLKLEKLTKVKEQYKLDILSLKAKISLCCGEKRETHREARADEFIGRLQRQLQELEARLEDTLSQLDDVQQERDTYKEKVAVLKQERDKWLSLSQQEADKAGQLADQLDAERRTVATLRDLVSELRQHNRNNGLDSSMLECDDPDTSIQSLSNLSICNEVCANVIEVQLMEERAKIEILKQEIQSLQEELAKVNQTYESEKLSLEAVITEKDGNISNLKQRVNEEIQEKSNLKSNYEQEIDKLNKQVLEMTQLIQNLEESSKHALEEKVLEIQSMQERFADETDKLGNVIKNLQEEFGTVNNLKTLCDEEIVILNTKVVELSQTIKNVEENSKHALEGREQEIRFLQQELTVETEKTSNIIKNLQMEIKEQNTLKKQCDEEIYVLSNKIAEISQKSDDAEENSKHLLEEKEKLQQQLSDETERSRNIIKKLQEQLEEQNNLRTNCEQEIVKLSDKVTQILQTITDKDQNILTLQRQLSEEIEKSGDIINTLQEKVTEQRNKETLHELEIVELNNKIDEMTQVITNVEESSKLALAEKEQDIRSLQQQFVDEITKTKDEVISLRKEIKEQNDMKIHCEQEINKLNNKINKTSQTLKSIEENSKSLLEEKESVIQTLHRVHSDEIEKTSIVIADLKKEIKEQNNLKTKREEKIIELNNKVDEMSQTIDNAEERSKHSLEEKEQKILTLQQQFASELEKYSNTITNLQEEIKELSDLKKHYEHQLQDLNNKVAETSQIMKTVEEISSLSLQEKDKEIQKLQQQSVDETEKSSDLIKTLQKDIEEQHNLRVQREQDIVILNNKIVEMAQTIKDLQESSKRTLEEKENEMESVQQKFVEDIKGIEVKNKILIEEQHNLRVQREQDIVILNNKVVEMAQTIKDLKESSKRTLEEKEKEMESVQQKFVEDIKGIEVKNKILIEEQHNLRVQREQDIVILNNKVVEMAQTIKDLKESSKRTLEEKEKEMESVQQKFADDIKKIEVKNKLLEIEILDAYNLKKSCDQEIVQLNTQIVEMSQTIKDTGESSKLALEEKMQEKHSLEVEFLNEREKFENIIQNLNKELETEKHNQLTLKEELQGQLNEKEMFIEKLEKEVKHLTGCVSSLEKRCEKIIDEKRKEVQSANEEIVKLNSKTVEMSQTMNALEENSSIALEEKVKELHSQYQQFTTERDKSENIIKNLKIELEAEKYAQLKLKDDFDNRIMKLNEKVLNRNNELVELQNNIIQKSEMIEVLQSDLRREKELRDELSNSCNHQLSTLNEQKNAVEIEFTGLQKQLNEKDLFNDKLNKEIDNLTTSISNLEEKCRHRDGVIKEKQKEIEFLNDVFQKEQEKLNHKIDERSACIKSLQMQLQNEIEYKIQLQNELSKLEMSKQSLKEELNAAKILMKDYEEKTLAWEKQKNEMEEEIQSKIQNIDKLETEKAMLLKEMEVIKETQSGETKDHEEKIIMLEKQKIEMDKQIEVYTLNIGKLEDDKAVLLSEVGTLKGALNKEKHNHEEETNMWEKQKTKLEEQIQDSVQMLEKLTDEKTILLNDVDALKTAQSEDKKNYEEKTALLEKQKNKLKVQIQDSILKNETLENEKVMLVNEISVLRTAQEEEIKNHQEKALLLEKQETEISEQIQASVKRIKHLEDENAALVKEMEALKDIHREDKRDHEENTLKWEIQTNDLKEKIQANTYRTDELQNEKASLLKEIEVLKTAQIDTIQDHEEKALTWVKQKIELEEQISTFAAKVENFEDEKAMLLKEMEALKTVQTEETKEHKENMNILVKQANELKDQTQTNVQKIENLEYEKAELLKEIEERRTSQSEEIKSHEEKARKWEKAIKEMEEQVQVNTLNVEKLEEEKAMLWKEMEVLKAAETEETKGRQEKALVWEKEKNETNQQLRLNVLKTKELEEKKEKMLKTIEELMAAQTDTCFKKEHEEKIRMLENKEKELKEQMKADVLKVDMLEQEKMMLLKELEALKAAQKEMLAAASQDKISSTKHTSWEKEIHGMHHQVDTTTSDLAHSSMESLKTISDLEKIIQDKNRKITSMQIEISYIKSMMAESGIKLIDVTKELEVSKDTCQELSSQLKKLVQQKNEEISELKRQVAKMSVTENRASQIIKLSAKYQAMILKRIAEIKSNAVLKELTNFGNQNTNGDELRRSIGSVTMEDLENFLETTDRHLKRCSEKQMTLQKDRDRLSEVNRINESEIINMKKFLTEMSVSFRTFTTVKEVYNQKLSKIVSLQRTVRRDILSLDGRITEATMCKLERGYAAVMQDLSECAMNLERWVDRSVSRMLSPEKIKQAFTSDLEQAALSTCNYQNASVEVQLSELENSFQKLLAEIDRAQKGEGARSAQEVTIMEVRAEYEDKLSRMKSKMKELFHEEMGRLKHKQADEIAILERELVKCREKMMESSRAYEEHIRALTTELWSVGEKFLVKQEEADWLRKKQSGSLMSLQHIHSSGLHHPPQEIFGRPSDTHSLRSLPVHNKKSEARGLHMSDEEGEVFDNRFLKELSATPRASLAPGQRISELKRRNSLVPPHLKSSYPAEMQFAPTLDEEDIKCASTSFSMGRGQRKEVGITAYKKPGPPTPSKQAGRLSATDSELRESLRVEGDPQGRKTSTPSRIRSLFRSNRNDTDVVTPRSRRFSNIFRKK